MPVPCYVIHFLISDYFCAYILCVDQSFSFGSWCTFRVLQKQLNLMSFSLFFFYLNH